MSESYDVVMLSAAFGDGHRQVAEALREGFAMRGVGVREVDSFYRTNVPLARASQWLYEWTTKRVPEIYGYSYRLTQDMSSNHWLWRTLSIFTNRGTRDILHQIHPRILIQLFPQEIPKELSLDAEVLLFVVLTDYSIHARWFHDRVNVYFIPSKDLLPQTRELANDAELLPHGIPVRHQFLACDLHARDRLLTSGPYILIATGGRGLFADLAEVIRALQHAFSSHKIIVLCGKNEEMRQQVLQLYEGQTKIEALGYQQDVASYLQNASFCIIKAGGVTVAECLAAACPMLVYKPQPGQEEDNARFVEHSKTGKAVNSLQDLHHILHRLVDSTDLEDMRDACIIQGQPQAADQIVTEVLRIAKDRIKIK